MHQNPCPEVLSYFQDIVQVNSYISPVFILLNFCLIKNSFIFYCNIFNIDNTVFCCLCSSKDNTDLMQSLFHLHKYISQNEDAH